MTVGMPCSIRVLRAVAPVCREAPREERQGVAEAPRGESARDSVPSRPAGAATTEHAAPLRKAAQAPALLQAAAAAARAIARMGLPASCLGPLTAKSYTEATAKECSPMLQSGMVG
jgi:hypothetical protein